MHLQVKNLNLIKSKINEIINKKKLIIPNLNIIAVSKTFSTERIIPLIEAQHYHFGENKVQEAEKKWPEIRKKYQNIKLHMIGKLQSNKAKKAVNLFDFIHSVDSIKLAERIDRFEKDLNKKVKIFIQINVGKEDQKSGVAIQDLDNFYNYCTKKLSLNVIGLMCLPPENEISSDYFKILNELSTKLKLKELSMGMSNDYLDAINYGATYLRIGRSIFGKRDI